VQGFALIDALAEQHLLALSDTPEVAQEAAALVLERREVGADHDRLQLIGQPGGHKRRDNCPGRRTRHAMKFELTAQRRHRARESGTLDASTFEDEIYCIHDSSFARFPVRNTH
jgi:hypothetical protein